jgi:hypothetical protein
MVSNYSIALHHCTICFALVIDPYAHMGAMHTSMDAWA